MANDLKITRTSIYAVKLANIHAKGHTKILQHQLIELQNGALLRCEAVYPLVKSQGPRFASKILSHAKLIEFLRKNLQSIFANAWWLNRKHLQLVEY